MAPRFPRLLLTSACLALAAATARPSTALAEAEIPLLARYDMEPDAADGSRMTDSGPQGVHGHLDSGVSFVDGGRHGKAVRFSGDNDNTVKLNGERKLLDNAGSPLTVAMWVKPEAFAQRGTLTALLSKREGWWAPTPFAVLMGDDGAVEAICNNGKDSSANIRWGGFFKVGEWSHVAFTIEADGERVLYLNGNVIHRVKVEGTLAANDQPLVFGDEKGGDFPGGGRSKYKGLLDDVHLYAAALSAEQIQADMNGTALPTRAPRVADFAAPSHYVHMWLGRYDMPMGFKGRINRTRAAAERIAGPDAVDWPVITVGGKRTFEKGAYEARFFPLRQDPDRKPLFRQGFDDACVVQPGDHWFRAVQWLWGRRYLYTTDRTARGADRDYEIWVFPVKIQGAGDADVRDVVLKNNGQTIYENAGPLRSLTLLLPQNSAGQPYELSVAGRAPVRFDAGLEPVKLGDPRDVPIPVNVSLPGDGPRITLRNLERPATFPSTHEWDEDAQQMTALRAANQAAATDPGAVPMVASWEMEPDPSDANKTLDAGAFKLNGQLVDGAKLVDGGRHGKALRLDGIKARMVAGGDQLNDLSDEATFAFWVRPDAQPNGDRAALLTKRPGWWSPSPMSIDYGGDGNLGVEGASDNAQWSGTHLRVGEWQHVAVTYKSGGEQVIYVDGKRVAGRPVGQPLKNNKDALVLGWEQGGDFPGGKYAGFEGLMDEVRVFSVALTQEQVLAEVNGTLKKRAPLLAKSPLSKPFLFTREVRSFKDHLGVEVPRSPLSIHTVNMTHGMSGGHFYGSEHGPGAFNGGGGFAGSVEDYAKYLADLGYDRVFERFNSGPPGPEDARSYERWLAALANHGVQGGLNATSLNDANLAFYTYTLPDYWRPQLRDAQLVAGRFARFPNFAGVTVGADNAGYAPYWDWAPVTPERPWGEAFTAFQEGRPAKSPMPTGVAPVKDYEVNAASMREFVDYIARYDESFRQYGRFAKAVQEVDPRLAFATQSFGSAPGVGGNGGYRWSSLPGLQMHDGVPVLQAYDWDETNAGRPMHNAALVDRLRSSYPDKPAWALLDDFNLKYTRAPRQRAFALALTRGVQSIGPNWLAHTAEPYARPQIAADERELYAWCHRYGGVYAMTEPQPAIGILYVHPQALARLSDAKDPRGPHEGKTTEALFFCHAAGWPAKIVTPEELRRGLPAGMKALLLVGLNKLDDSWHWYEGMEKELAGFVQGGGRLLMDDESESPAGVPATKTGMVVAAYIAQGSGVSDMEHGHDKTPVLIERNLPNITKLRAAMAGVPAPVAVSTEPTVWAVPTVAGDVRYVTVVNQGSEPGKNAAQFVRPQTGKLAWNTDRPIYDVRRGARITPEQAASVDLTKEGFQWFALPPAEVSAPRLRVSRGEEGFFTAEVTMGDKPMAGIPVRITVTRGAETAEVFTATGAKPARLPLRESDAAGEYAVTATELLSGLNGNTAKVTTRGANGPGVKSVAPAGDAIRRFLGRKEIPLVVALTPEQATDAAMKTVADQLVATFAAAGRKAEIRRIAQNDVVVSLQPTGTTQYFPRWHTVDADLVLLGTPADNLLLFDQARGYLLPPDLLAAADARRGGACVTFSPFSGGFQALNLLGSDPAALGTGLAQVREEISRANPVASLAR